MMFFNEIGIFPLLGLLFLGVLYWLFVWSFRRFVPVVVNIGSDPGLFYLWVFRISSILWIAYAIFAIYHLLQLSPGITIIILVLFVILGWPLWKDLVPGFLIRFGYVAQKGDQLLFDGRMTTIEAFAIRYLRLKTEEGNILLIPYHQLGSLTIFQTLRKGQSNDYSFSIRIEEMSKDDAFIYIRNFIKASPWSLSGHEAQISSDDEQNYRITITALNEEIAAKLIRDLRKSLEKESNH